MRDRVSWLGLLLLLTAWLAGCGTEPATPEAAAARARAFMQARVNGDAGTVWGALSERAQRSLNRSQVARHLRQERATYAALGTPREVEPGVVRITVKDLTLAARDRSVVWPESWLTLRREGDQWRVAWAEPLFGEAAQAYHNGRYADQLRLGHAIVAIDPFHHRGHLELHYAYRGLNRLREAELALVNAAERATEVEQPAVLDATARFKLTLNAPAEAITYTQRALELAVPHAPATYSPRWQADTLVVAARAAVALGDRQTATALMDQAASLDPDSPSLAIFRHQLAGGPPVPSANR